MLDRFGVWPRDGALRHQLAHFVLIVRLIEAERGKIMEEQRILEGERRKLDAARANPGAPNTMPMPRR